MKLIQVLQTSYILHFRPKVMKMAEISPLLPETPSPPLPDVKLQNHFAANKTRKEQLEMFKTSKQQKMFTGGKTTKEELLNMKAGKEENLFSPPPRVRNPSKRDRTRKHSSGEFCPDHLDHHLQPQSYPHHYIFR